MTSLLVIPTYNERDNCRRLVAEVDKLGRGRFHMLFVDDNSPDGTGRSIEEMRSGRNDIFVIHRENKSGLGSAYLAGLQRAIRGDYAYIFEMDADLSHDPAYLEEMLARLGEFDVVIGSRFMGGLKNINSTPMRILTSLIASAYMRFILGLGCTDPMGGFVGYRREVLELIDYDNFLSRGYAFQAELKYECMLRGARIGEVPIIFKNRSLGDSKMSRWDVLEALWHPWRIRFSKKRRPGNKMKVLFLALGSAVVASSRGRVYQFLPHLKRAGITAKVIPFTPNSQALKMIHEKKRNLADKAWCRICNYFALLIFLFSCRLYDVLYIQKVILPPFMMKLIKRVNSRIIFDFDDPLFLGDIYHAKRSRKLDTRIDSMLMHSRCVIVGNDFLAGRVSRRNNNVHVLTTPVDTRRLRPRENAKGAKDDIVIGWIGSPNSCRFLNDLGGVFESLARKYRNIRFEFIGADGFYKGKERFRIKEWTLDSEHRDLQNLDIGLMPLNDDEWCRGKGGYKLLQYMAVGIPCLASPLGVNKEIVSDGVTGFFAKDPTEWLKKLSQLIEDDGLRTRMGAEGRKKTEAAYSYQVSAPWLIKILRSI